MPKAPATALMLPALMTLGLAASVPAAAEDAASAYGYPAYHAYGYRGFQKIAPPPTAAAVPPPATAEAPKPALAAVPPMSTAGQPPILPQTLQPAAEGAPTESTPPTAAVPPPPVPRKPVPKPVVVAAVEPRSYVASANSPELPTELTRGGKQSIPAVARLQILLDRANVSPGVIDGVMGSNLSKAVAALENMNGLPSTGRMNPAVDAILAAHGATPVLVPYVVTAADVSGPFVKSMPKDYGEMAKLPSLAYRGPSEALAERFHMDEAFLKSLNPGARFAEGETITVADVGPRAKAKVYHVVADAAVRQVFGYDAAWNLVVAYPATIGSTDMPSPSGIHAVKAIAIDPEYWYRPKVNFQQGKNDKPLKLAPGPNNPVGAVWIGLDKPTYGIHGTPEPSRIDKTNSHGCLRLTNWDANELAHLVRPGVDVEFVDPTRTASVAPAAPTVAPKQPMPAPLARP